MITTTQIRIAIAFYENEIKHAKDWQFVEMYQNTITKLEAQLTNAKT